MVARHAVIVTAAGSSNRFNGNSTHKEKKEFLSIDGQSILCRAIRPFLDLEGLVALVVTYREGDLQTVKDLVSTLPLDGIDVLFVQGGDTRQASVFNALKALYDREKSLNIEYVSIHDGARPFIDTNLAKACLEAAATCGGACPGLRITDTMVRTNDQGLVCERMDRTGVCSIQTPQTFRFPDIYKAHLCAMPDKLYTDDTEVFMDWGGKVAIVPGSRENRKITFANDLGTICPKE